MIRVLVLSLLSFVALASPVAFAQDAHQELQETVRAVVLEITDEFDRLPTNLIVTYLVLELPPRSNKCEWN